MKLFDLHTDTLSMFYRKEFNTAVDLDSLGEFEHISRAFAVFTPDKLKGKEAENHFDNLFSVFKEKIEPLKSESFTPFLTCENASVLAGRIENIEKLSKCGVKTITFTWNGENELGYGVDKNKGIKTFGKECIPIFEKYGIIIDVSHISDKGFYDILSLSQKPVIASHSNSRKICPHKRNLSDEQILEIIKRKGLIGLNFYRGFLNSENASEIDILRHTEYILSLGGEDALSIGTDFDGADIIEEFDCDNKLLKLEKLFLDNGFEKQIVDKILFNNANRFLQTFIRMCKYELQQYTKQKG